MSNIEFLSLGSRCNALIKIRAFYKKIYNTFFLADNDDVEMAISHKPTDNLLINCKPWGWIIH